jgi:hypothetical protein
MAPGHCTKPCGRRAFRREIITAVRDLDGIDDELRLLAAVRRSIRRQDGEPSSRPVDELLDERLRRDKARLAPP